MNPQPLLCIRVLLVGAAVLLAAMALSQEQHPAAPPPPPNAKKVQCKGRPVPQLEDVTEKAGIRFRHIANPLSTYIVESMSGGVILWDYDRDGWLDIYFTNAPTINMALRKESARAALYHNNHDGTFSDVTDKSGLAAPCFAMGGAVADYNNDGWPDLYLTCLGGNVLFRNNGDGTFTDVTAKAGVADGRMSVGAAFGDYDRDGFVDLMVANYVDFQLDHLPPFGGKSLCKYRGIDVYCGPRGLKGAGDSLFHNNGDGTFTDVSKAAGVDDPHGYYGLGVVWADFNNTGWPDIYVANDTLPNFLYRNDGKGKFTEIGLESGTALSETGSEQASMGVALGDYLHNGRPSIYVTNFGDDYSDLYRNDGNWMFTDVSYASGVALPSFPLVKWGDAFVDLDNDGWLDLVAVSGHVYPQMEKVPASGGYAQTKLLHMNQKDGTFCDAGNLAGPALEERRVSRGLAVGDLFNDGNVDVVVEDLDGAPMILQNHGVFGRHWVSLELASTRSNRMAIGARVKIVAGGMTQTDEVRSGGSYISQSDFRLHFGLGSAEKIESLEVRWPSGKVETFKNLAADRFYALLEGEGVVPAERIRPVSHIRFASEGFWCNGDFSPTDSGFGNMPYNQNHPPRRSPGTRRMTFDEASKLIKKGDIIRLRKELQGGLSPNLANESSWTLLMVAALEGNTSIGSLLIESGAELDRRNKFNGTALSLAAHSGHGAFVDLLLTSGASLECHPFGNTFDAWLDWACRYGRCSEKIRGLFDKERKIRTARDQALDRLT